MGRDKRKDHPQPCPALEKCVLDLLRIISMERAERTAKWDRVTVLETALRAVLDAHEVVVTPQYPGSWKLLNERIEATNPVRAEARALLRCTKCPRVGCKGCEGENTQGPHVATKP
jgi:hypothetical protein